MEHPRLTAREQIKQEPDFEEAGRDDTDGPIFLGKFKREHDDDASKAQCHRQDSGRKAQARLKDKKDRKLPGREKLERHGELGEIFSCVRGYLPHSRVEYLQVMPGGRFLEIGKEDSFPAGFPESSSGTMNMEGRTSVIDESENCHKASRIQKLNTFSQRGLSVDGTSKIIKGRPFTCDVCGVGFIWRSHLNRHKRIHTGVKAYKCDVCGVAFTQGEHLKDHKRMHTGEKPFKCDMCGVGFASCTSLKHHKRVHTGEKPYKCEMCGAGFAQNSNLTMHRRTHTGEKPYRCEMCGVGFSRGEHLKKHNRIHTGERPYICDVCGLGFAVSTSLRTHKRVHTKQKV